MQRQYNEAGISTLDEDLLREALRVADRAASAGNHPFGAILASAEGEILVRAENTVLTQSDPTGHAETNLIRQAFRSGYADSLEKMTLYASAEPCPMCSGAIYWGNISRVVFGLSQERLYTIVRDAGGRDALKFRCRDILSHGVRSIVVLGPALEDEAAKSHESFWPGMLP